MSSTPDPSAPPHAYICPITSSLMVDPVIDPEGNSYERSAITEWLGRSGGWGSSPVTRRRLGVRCERSEQVETVPGLTF